MSAFPGDLVTNKEATSTTFTKAQYFTKYEKKKKKVETVRIVSSFEAKCTFEYNQEGEVAVGDVEEQRLDVLTHGESRPVSNLLKKPESRYNIPVRKYFLFSIFFPFLYNTVLLLKSYGALVIVRQKYYAVIFYFKFLEKIRLLKCHWI